jgi:hypothetical protein
MILLGDRGDASMAAADNEDDAKVGWFERIDILKGATIFRLVTSQLSAHENSPNNRFHIRFTLGCGDGEIDGQNARYAVHLRQCIVAMRTTGCEADLSSAYSYELPESYVKDSSSQDIKETAGRSLEAKTEIGGVTSSGAITGKILAKIGVNRSSRKTANREIKIKKRIMLVACNGDHWLVGDDEHGDPRQIHGRLKERYFHENPGQPLCGIDVPIGTEVAEIFIEVRAKFGHLDVELLDELGRPRRKAREMDALDISDALKARIRGIAIAKALRKRQEDNRVGERLPEREFLLSSNTLRVHMPKVATVGRCEELSTPIAKIPQVALGEQVKSARRRTSK